MRNNKILFAVLTAALALTLVLAGCSKKDSNGGNAGGGSSGGSASVSVPNVGKAAPASDFSYDLSEDGKGVVIKSYTGKGGKVVIPAEIEGLPVVELADKSFIGETRNDLGPGYDLTAVVIPASVIKIGYAAFQDCKKLTSVTFLGSGVELQQGTFRGCGELTELVFPDSENAFTLWKDEYSQTAANAFSGCKKLPLAVRGKLNAMGFTEI